jgi:SpoVK/Ycf46/Vps4 family AAA+-type ATPase
LPLDSSIRLNELAEQLKGYTGADIQSLVREATFAHIKSKRQIIVYDDFLNAIRFVHPSISSEMASQYTEFVNIFGGS